MNQLSTTRRTAVIAALVEGASINSTVRMIGVSKPTILKLIRDLGSACLAYHDKHVRGLKPERIQTDEIWSFTYCKAKNVATAKSPPPEPGDYWTWTAIDSDSNLMIAYRVGLRTKEDANEFMLGLAGRIVSHAQLTSDGHTAYLGAVENAFGFDVDSAQLQKVYGPDPGEKGPERKYNPGKCNLTIRMSMRRYTRLTNAHSKKLENHACAVAMFFMFYNFCRVHSTVGTSPAGAAGIADHVWTLEELIGLLD